MYWLTDNPVKMRPDSVSDAHIFRIIYLLRGRRIILDCDLAALYGIGRSRLRYVLKRYRSFFPASFVFQINNQECAALKINLNQKSAKGDKNLPLAFTENGILMISRFLNNPRIMLVNFKIIRCMGYLKIFGDPAGNHGF